MKLVLKLAVIVIALMFAWRLYLVEETYRIAKYTDDQFVIVHRGEMIERPEQTMVAFNYAHDNGVRIMECDAQITKDGVFVAMHDTTWDRTTNGSGSIASTDWYGYGEWLDAGSWYDDEYAGEGVPTMAEIFSWAHGNSVLLWVDCYFSGAYDSDFMELIQEHDMEGRVVLQFVVETRDFHRGGTFEGMELSYRVAVPIAQTVLSAIEWAEADGVQYMTIPWEMGLDYIYEKASENDVKLILFAFNQYKSKGVSRIAQTKPD